MKLSLTIIILVVFSGLTDTNAGQFNLKEAGGDINVYYFHATRRCATCQAIEKVALKTVKDNYGDEIGFIVINREEKENKALVEKYKISGQTLLVVKGETIENITNQAFMNALNNPEKLEELILSTIAAMEK